jgi:hypothetical protein
MITHRLLFIPLILILAGCADVTSQSHILARAKSEVSVRENWADQAYIRVERSPRKHYYSWRDLTWRVHAGAFDYTDYPNYKGIQVVPGSERILTFSRDGCLVGYEDGSRPCAEGPYAPAASTNQTIAESTPIK